MELVSKYGIDRQRRMEKENKSLDTEKWENIDTLYTNKIYYYYYYYNFLHYYISIIIGITRHPIILCNNKRLVMRRDITQEEHTVIAKVR